MIDELINRVKQGFDRIEDHRMPGGNLRYTLSDVLMSAYAMFSLKDPSLLVFRQRLEERWENLNRIYHAKAVPADTALRQTLDGVSPSALQAQFQPLLECKRPVNYIPCLISAGSGTPPPTLGCQR